MSIKFAIFDVHMSSYNKSNEELDFWTNIIRPDAFRLKPNVFNPRKIVAKVQIFSSSLGVLKD